MNTKNTNPTLMDVILTNKPSYCQNITNFNCGLSDVHNLISFQLKGYVPKLKKYIFCIEGLKILIVKFFLNIYSR